jgi:NADH-quinone oxidoreductase subunit J
VPRYLAAVFCGVFFGLIAFVCSHELIFPLGLDAGGFGTTANGISTVETPGNPHEVGIVLLTEYLYPFELAALLLLAAIIGAVLLAYENKRPLAPGRGLKAVQQRCGEV